MPSLGIISSPELKAQVSISDRLLSVDRFHIFIFFSRTTGSISSKLGTKHLLAKKIHVYLNKGPRPFPRGDNYEKALKNFQNYALKFAVI